MTEPIRAMAKHGGGRRAGESGTRASILAAARRLFATEGADGTTIRAVAQAAGVDPALVMHYFGSKDGLFQAAIEWPIDMGEAMGRVVKGDIDGLGERVVRFYLELWEDEATRHPLEIIMRGAMRRQADTRLLTEFVHDQIVERLAGALSGPDAELRGSHIPSTLVGLAMARYILRLPPLADLEADEVVAIVAPTIQRYVNGPLRIGATR
jgi:AcrR family transcriptional regulator